MAMPSWPFMAGTAYQETRRAPIAVTLSALVLGLFVATSPARAEITAGAERPVQAGHGIGTRPLNVLEGDVRARCWQQGREILSEAEFAGAAIPPGLREQAVSLSGAGRSAVLLPFADTFCLLTVRP